MAIVAHGLALPEVGFLVAGGLGLAGPPAPPVSSEFSCVALLLDCPEGFMVVGSPNALVGLGSPAMSFGLDAPALSLELVRAAMSLGLSSSGVAMELSEVEVAEAPVSPVLEMVASGAAGFFSLIQPLAIIDLSGPSASLVLGEC